MELQRHRKEIDDLKRQVRAVSSCESPLLTIHLLPYVLSDVPLICSEVDEVRHDVTVIRPRP